MKPKNIKLTDSKILPQGGNYDGYEYTFTVSVELGKDFSLSDVKQAITQIKNFVNNEVFVDSPHSDYDCTGQHFTRNIELIHKFVGYEWLHYTYIHSIGIDV